MTVDELITALNAVRTKHGGDTKVQCHSDNEFDDFDTLVAIDSPGDKIWRGGTTKWHFDHAVIWRGRPNDKE